MKQQAKAREAGPSQAQAPECREPEVEKITTIESEASSGLEESEMLEKKRELESNYTVSECLIRGDELALLAPHYRKLTAFTCIPQTDGLARYNKPTGRVLLLPHMSCLRNWRGAISR